MCCGKCTIQYAAPKFYFCKLIPLLRLPRLIHHFRFWMKCQHMYLPLDNAYHELVNTEGDSCCNCLSWLLKITDLVIELLWPGSFLVELRLRFAKTVRHFWPIPKILRDPNQSSILMNSHLQSRNLSVFGRSVFENGQVLTWPNGISCMSNFKVAVLSSQFL